MAREEIDRLEADETRLARGPEGAPAPARPCRRRQRHPRDPGRAPAARRPRSSPPSSCGCTSRYATRHGCRAEVMSLNETGIGGVKEAIVEIAGDGAYSRLKFESGTHRVQRVPATESSGRIHTSTATVVVMPEVEETEIEIDEERDLRIDVKRSSGPGRPVGEHDRLGGADHAPPDRPRRRDPGREEPAQEQGQGTGRAPGPAPGGGAPAAARGGLGDPPIDDRGRRPGGQDPDLQLPAGPGHRPPGRAWTCRTCRG